MDVQPLVRRITRRLPALWIGAFLALACCSTALAAASASTSHAATIGARRQVEGPLQRRRFGSLHDSLEEDRLAAAREHHALESAGEVRHQRQREQREDQVRRGQRRRQVQGQGQGDVDVRHLDEPAGRRQLERHEGDEMSRLGRWSGTVLTMVSVATVVLLVTGWGSALAANVKLGPGRERAIEPGAGSSAGDSGRQRHEHHAGVRQERRRGERARGGRSRRRQPRATSDAQSRRHGCQCLPRGDGLSTISVWRRLQHGHGAQRPNRQWDPVPLCLRGDPQPSRTSES